MLMSCLLAAASKWCGPPPHTSCRIGSSQWLSDWLISSTVVKALLSAGAAAADAVAPLAVLWPACVGLPGACAAAAWLLLGGSKGCSRLSACMQMAWHVCIA